MRTSSPRERRCRTWDAVTVAWTVALRALHRGDGAGARAGAAEMMVALRWGSGGDGTGARGAGAPNFGSSTSVRHHYSFGPDDRLGDPFGIASAGRTPVRFVTSSSIRLCMSATRPRKLLPSNLKS